MANVRLATIRALQAAVSPGFTKPWFELGQSSSSNSHRASHVESNLTGLEPIGRKTLNFVRRAAVAVPKLCVRIGSHNRNWLA
jgi:hypothetical protein